MVDIAARSAPGRDGPGVRLLPPSPPPAAPVELDPDQAAALQPSFDFSIAEECAAYGECSLYTPFTTNNKAVLHVEYEGSLTSFCPTTKALGFSSMLKRLELDAWRAVCP